MSNWLFGSEPPPPGGHLPLGSKETLKMVGAGLAWLLLGVPLVAFMLLLLF